MHHTATKGNIGVAKATADLLIKGWDVLMPICSTSPFDLVIYRDGRFLRVQVKYRTPARGFLEVRARRASISPGKTVKNTKNNELDIVCVYNPEDDSCYYVAASQCPVNLRVVAKCRNKRIRMAVDFRELPL